MQIGPSEAKKFSFLLWNVKKKFFFMIAERILGALLFFRLSYFSKNFSLKYEKRHFTAD